MQYLTHTTTQVKFPSELMNRPSYSPSPERLAAQQFKQNHAKLFKSTRAIVLEERREREKREEAAREERERVEREREERERAALAKQLEREESRSMDDIFGRLGRLTSH